MIKIWHCWKAEPQYRLAAGKREVWINPHFVASFSVADTPWKNPVTGEEFSITAIRMHDGDVWRARIDPEFLAAQIREARS